MLSLPLVAHTEKNANGNGGTSYGNENTGDLTPETNTKGSEEPEEELGDTKKSDTEPDSSYYSVNKFNFLFYFVYKMKYMDDQEVEKPNSED